MSHDMSGEGLSWGCCSISLGVGPKERIGRNIDWCTVAANISQTIGRYTLITLVQPSYQLSAPWKCLNIYCKSFCNSHLMTDWSVFHLNGWTDHYFLQVSHFVLAFLCHHFKNKIKIIKHIVLTYSRSHFTMYDSRRAKSRFAWSKGLVSPATGCEKKKKKKWRSPQQGLRSPNWVH